MNDKIIRKRLPVVLTIDEKVVYGRQLAQLHQEYSRIEIDKKNAADDFKERLEKLDGRISYYAAVIEDEQEYREVECKWRYLFETNTKEWELHT